MRSKRTLFSAVSSYRLAPTESRYEALAHCLIIGHHREGPDASLKIGYKGSLWGPRPFMFVIPAIRVQG
jgi:hypothetical protein